jgi:Sulfotransferase family
VIGATGGSGTRVVARIVKRAGMFLGSGGLNESEDSLCIADFYDRWLNEWVPQRDVAETRKPQLLDDFRRTVRCHLSGLPGPRPWGWKEPRSMYLVPLFERHFANLRFLHVVRDGRDMALSSNQNQLRKHGSLAGLPRAGLSPAAQSIALWAWANGETARFGSETLGDRYLRIRFEDLCREPAAVARQVFEFFRLEADPNLAVDEVAPPSSLGRWREEDPGLVAELEAVAGPGLDELGYR